MAILTKPISIKDIGQTLGSASRDLGTLCSSQNINMWAKRKPFRYNAFHIPDADKEAIRAACNYGVGWTKYASGAEVISAMDADTLTWYKELPRGLSSNEPYRLLDFDGYNHNAACPFALSAEQNISEQVTGTTELVGLEDSFLPGDLLNYHFALTFKKGSSCLTYVDPRTIGSIGQYQMAYSKTIAPSAIGGYGTAMLYSYLVPSVPPAMYDETNSHLYNYGSNRVYPFPLEAGKQDFIIRESALDIILDVTYLAYSLTWTCTLANNLVADAAFVCNSAVVEYSTGPGTSATVDYTSVFPSQTIAKGSSLSVSRSYGAQSGIMTINYTITFYGTLSITKTKVISF